MFEFLWTTKIPEIYFFDDDEINISDMNSVFPRKSDLGEYYFLVETNKENNPYYDSNTNTKNKYAVALKQKETELFNEYENNMKTKKTSNGKYSIYSDFTPLDI